MLELQNVSKYYTANGVTNIGLRNVSLKFEKNEIVAITGDSGSGKSTLLNVITKTDTFDEGEIYYKGNETSYFSVSDMDDFRKNKIGFIFQNYNIIDSYTVLENVMLPLTLLGKSKKEARERAEELIKKVGLSGKEKNRGSKLSGGEKQRCVIARALASECEILACDEPTGNLDSKTGAEIIRLIKEVAKDKLVFIVTHDFSQVQDIVTRKIRVSDGEIVDDVTFTPQKETPAEDLDLDYKPLPKKVSFTVAMNNILFTPKKSIFLFSIFFVIALAALFAFQATYASYCDMYYSTVYYNTQSNRVYVYTEDKSPIDLEKIKAVSDEYVPNPFYEDRSPYGNFYELAGNYSSLYNAFVPGIELKEGRMPAANAENEALVVLPADGNYDEEWMIRRIAAEFENDVEIYVEFEDITLKDGSVLSSTVTCRVVGCAVSSEINEIMITGAPALEKMLHTYTLSATVNGNAVKVFADYTAGAKPIITLPESYREKEVTVQLTVQKIYDLTDYYTIEYDDTAESPVVTYNPCYTEGFPVYEVSVYADDAESAAKALRAAGLCADVTATFGRSMTSDIEELLQNIAVMGLMALLAVGILELSLITYFILARVYDSKKKDYQILRTLGVTKKDMRHIVNLEVLVVGMVATVLAFVVFLLLVNGLPAIAIKSGAETLAGLTALKDLAKISAASVVVYLLLMAAFIYYLAKLFNNRLFKFSVSKSLKGGDFFD